MSSTLNGIVTPLNCGSLEIITSFVSSKTVGEGNQPFWANVTKRIAI